MNASCPHASCDSCPNSDVVCRCLGITESQIVTVIETLGLRSVKEVCAHTGAGDGCTCCHVRIRTMLETVPVLVAAG